MNAGPRLCTGTARHAPQILALAVKAITDSENDYKAFLNNSYVQEISSIFEQPQNGKLSQLKQECAHQTGRIPAPHGRQYAAQRQHQPIGQRKHKPAQRIARTRGQRNALVLHIQAQQTGAGEQTGSDFEQQGNDLVEHGKWGAVPAHHSGCCPSYNRGLRPLPEGLACPATVYLAPHV